ncbi:MAG: hypothetical protein QOI38_769 [Sphingomonadales bacterium]|jgi:dipeptidyl aminopeptidase/acylaminoacyl peptidase|nr:hypothetical protein [Sphingomonadales bacterium]
MRRTGISAAAALLTLAAPAPTGGQSAAVPPASAQAAASAPGAAPIALERFAELPLLRDPLLSPDGSRIAARMIVEGEERIGIWTLRPGAAPELQSFRTPGLRSFQWAGNGRLVIRLLGTMTLGPAGRTALPVLRVVAYDLASRQAVGLGEGNGLGDDIVMVDPEGRYVLLETQPSLVEPPAVHRIDLATGASSVVQGSRGGVWTWFADRDGVVRAGIANGERRTNIYYRPAAGAELREIEDPRIDRDDSVVETIRFLPGSDGAVILTNAVTGRFAAYRYDFAAGRIGDALFEHPTADVSALVTGPDGAVEGVAYEDERPRTHWFDPEMARTQQSIDRIFPGKTNAIVNRSRDGNRMLVFSAAADDPGTYYVYDRQARRMERFASPFEGLQGARLATVRPISYQSRSGLRIEGYITLPPDRPERSLPLIVLPHDGPLTRASWRFDADVQFLASRGYAVLQPNFRGSAGYGRDFVLRGLGQLDRSAIEDIEDGIDWAAGQGIIDPGRVCIMGSSFGGYAAIAAAVRAPQRYRCAVAWAGSNGLESILTFRPGRPLRYVRAFRGRTMLVQVADAAPPARQAQRLRVPLLVGEGAGRNAETAAESRRLLAALQRSDAAIESASYARAGDAFLDARERVDWLRRLEAFLARYNPPQAPAGR